MCMFACVSVLTPPPPPRPQKRRNIISAVDASILRSSLSLSHTHTHTHTHIHTHIHTHAYTHTKGGTLYPPWMQAQASLGQQVCVCLLDIRRHVYVCVSDVCVVQHTATHCNTLQHTATHCNTLQHTATHCKALQHTAAHCNTLQHTATHYGVSDVCARKNVCP